MSYRRHSSLLLGAVLLLSSAELRAADDEPSVVTPRGGRGDVSKDDGLTLRYPPTSARYAAIGAGAGFFAIPYGLSVMSASVWSDTPGASWLYVPVAGPIGAIANNRCAVDDPNCGAILYLRGFLYAFDFLGQVGGLALVTEGLLMTTEAPASSSETSWTLLPDVGPNHAGMQWVGTF
ncbi:MAG: hypothetical protein AAGA56_26170 [Myxococcota bacterium]